MRTAFTLVTLLLLASCLGAFTTAAEMTDDGSSITVTGTETWNGTNPIDKDLFVKDGASLIISDATTVNQGVTITVESGALLTVNADVTGTELDAGLLIYNDTTLNLDFGDLSETGQVRINFDHTIPETAQLNVTIGDETRDAVGSDFVDIPAPLNGTPLVVEFNIYYFFATQVTSVQALHSGSSGTVIHGAVDINHTGGSLKWNSAAFDLDVEGTLVVQNAKVSGAAITCINECSMTGVTLTGSAPVHVADSGELSIDTSVIQGSRTDEDIIVHDTATISYTDNTGTGGQTDAWIRLLSQRTLHTNAGNITVHATGLGYYGSTMDNITDSNGHVNFALSENTRIVEWVDGNGDYHEEDAEIVLTLSSNWGNFATTINAPRTPVSSVTIPLPYIDVKSINLKDNKGYLGSKVSGDVVIENTGTASVTGVNFWCYVGQELQDTTQLVVSLEPGESKTLYVSWYGNALGSQSLECRALLPTVLQSISADVTNTNGATSQDIAWNAAEETEDQPLMIYAILVVIILAGTFVVSNQAAKRVNQEVQNALEEDDDAEEEEKVYIDDEAVTDSA